MATSAVASAETVRFYCHTCSAILSLPAPPSPFHFTLCPRCGQDYLDDSPTPHHQAPQPVLPPPPPPPPCPVPFRTSSSSSPSSTTLTSRSSTVAGTMSTSRDLVPPPLPPWLLQASGSDDTWDCFFESLGCPPPPIRHVSSSSSSSSTTAPRTLVSKCTRPSSSSTRPPLPPSNQGTWDYFFDPSESVVAPAKEDPPLLLRPLRLSRREFRLLGSQEEQRRRSSPAVSSLSSPYSSAYTSPLLASPPLQRQHQGEMQPESSPLALSLSTAGETMSTSQEDVLPLPPPPPPLPWDSPLHGAWQDEYIISPSSFRPSDFDYESPPRPPPSLLPVSSYGATFETPLQRGWSPTAPPPVSANDATFDMPPLQRGGSQAAPAESIAALPTITVTDAALVCAVCTDPLLASAPARLLPCGHQYHSDCIVTWLSLRNSCPVCRGSIPAFHSTATDLTSSPSPSLHPTPPDRRRSLPGGRRIRRICSRLLRRDRQTSSSGDVHV